MDKIHDKLVQIDLDLDDMEDYRETHKHIEEWKGTALRQVHEALQELQEEYAASQTGLRRETSCFITGISELSSKLDTMQSRNDQLQWTTREMLNQTKGKFTQVHLALGRLGKAFVEAKETMDEITEVSTEMMVYTKRLGAVVCEHHGDL